MLQGPVQKPPHGSGAGPRLAAVTQVAAAAPAMHHGGSCQMSGGPEVVTAQGF